MFSSAELCSRYKPQVPIIAISRNDRTARQLHLYRGVFPLFYSKSEREADWPRDIDARINYGISIGKARGFIRDGDPIVVITGWRQGSGIGLYTSGEFYFSRINSKISNMSLIEFPIP